MATVRANGVELYYERAGTGEPVILVHGGLVDGSSWALLVPELTGDYEVVTYDQRGHSRSERPPGGLLIDDLVADLAALIEQLGIAPAHVVGLSMGGTVALGLAARSPGLIRTLAVHEPAVFALLAGDPAAKACVDAVAEIFQRVVRTVSTDPLGAVHFFFERVAPGAWSLMPDDVRKQTADNARYSFRGGLPGLDADLVALSRCAAPALLTRGEATPKEFGWEHLMPLLERTMKRARLVTIGGAGHAPPLTHPAEYGALLRDFFAGSTS